MLIPIPHNASSTTSLLLCLSSAWPTIRTFILRSSAYLLLLNLFLFFDKVPSSPPPSPPPPSFPTQLGKLADLSPLVTSTLTCLNVSVPPPTHSSASQLSHHYG
jgi:hypothetical protein